MAQKSVINTFEKGLTSDVHEQYQPKGSYRNIRNMRLVNNGGNNYTVQSDEGMSITVTIPQPFIAPNEWEVVGWDSYTDLDIDSRKLRVIVFLNDRLSSGWGQIGIFSLDTSTGIGIYEAQYTHSKLDIVQFMYDTMVKTIYETSNFVRTYWTDIGGEPKVLNLALLAKTYLLNATLAIGEQVMVTSGSITYNGITYGPFDPQGNIITGNGTALSAAAPGTTVKPYVPIEQLDWVVDRTLLQITNLAPSPGVVGANIQCGSYTIAARLRYRDEYKSPWTIVNNIQHITQEDPTAVNYQLVQGDKADVYTNKQLNWVVRAYDSHYDTLEVVLVRSVGENIWDIPVIIYSDSYVANGGTNVISYTGSESNGTLTPLELAEILQVFKTVGTIESSKNRMFAGDISYYEDLPEIDFSSVSINEQIYSMPHDNFDYPTNPPLFGQPYIVSDISSGDILADGKYQVTGAGFVTYNGNQYLAGDIFTGVYGVNSYTESAGTNNVVPVSVSAKYIGATIASGSLVIGQRYLAVGNVTNGSGIYIFGDYFVATSTTYGGGGDAVEATIEITSLANDYWDHKGVVNGSHKKSYMRSETYRLGILPYDKKGNPMAVRFLDDHTFGDADLRFLLNEDFTSKTDAEYRINSLGLKIGGNQKGNGTPLDLTSWIDPEGDGQGVALYENSLISGFSIVRAKRVERVIAKGILFYTAEDIGNPNHYNPEAHTRDDWDKNAVAPNTYSDKYYLLYAPDLLLDSGIVLDDEDLELVAETCLRADSGVLSTDPKGITEITAGTDNDAFYHKYVVKIGVSGMNLGDTGEIDQIIKVFQGQTAVEIDSQDITKLFDNTIETDPTNWIAVAPTCSAAQTGVGGTTHVLRLSDMTSGNFFPHAGAGDARKLYVSVRRKGTAGYPENENTLYYPTGHYQPITQAIMNANGFEFSGIDIFGGDTYLGLFDYARTLMDEESSTTLNTALGIIFPCESRMNFNLRRGRHFARDGFKVDTTNPNGISEISPENLILDDHYKTNEYLIGYPGFEKSASTIITAPRQVSYSDVKTNGELIDNWRQFRSGNSSELDSNGGRVIALITKQNYLFAFQRDMVTYLPVNQQAAISESFNQLFTIGVGGVIDRYDNVDSFLGLDDKGAIVETPDGLVYFNRENQAIVYMKTGTKGAEISTIKFIKEIIDDVVFLKSLAKIPPLVATNTSPTIVAGYDNRNKEVFMTFNHDIKENFTISMDDTLKMFTGIYDFVPLAYMAYRNLLISTPNLNAYRTINGSTSYVVGDTVKEGGTLYVCIADLAATHAGTAPSANPTNWKLFWTSGELYTHNTNKTKSAFYYGRSYEEKIEMIVNDENNSQKMFDAYSINGEVHNGEDDIANAVVDGTGMIDAIDTKTTYQDRTETPFDLKWRNNNFIGTYQTNSADTISKRLRDKFLSVTLRKKNWVGDDPTTNTGILRKIVSLVTKLRNSF